MSIYFVKRKGYSKIQGPYSVTRLKRYAEQQRLWSDDLISKDRETWKNAGDFNQLFPNDYNTLTLSAEPEFTATAFDNEPTATTLLDAIDLKEYEDEEDTAYITIEPEALKSKKIPLLMMSTYFVFGVSFGFGLFIAIQNMMN